MKIIVIPGASDGRGADIARLLVSRHVAQIGLVMTARGKLGGWLKLIAPVRAEGIALAALNGEVKPS